MTDPELIEAARIDSMGIHLQHPHLISPDGDPWCHFGAGLACTNGVDCLNPAHRHAE